jgi:hypothetical protein
VLVLVGLYNLSAHQPQRCRHHIILANVTRRSPARHHLILQSVALVFFGALGVGLGRLESCQAIVGQAVTSKGNATLLAVFGQISDAAAGIDGVTVMRRLCAKKATCFSAKVELVRVTIARCVPIRKAVAFALDLSVSFLAHPPVLDISASEAMHGAQSIHSAIAAKHPAIVAGFDGFEASNNPLGTKAANKTRRFSVRRKKDHLILHGDFEHQLPPKVKASPGEPREACVLVGFRVRGS